MKQKLIILWFFNIVFLPSKLTAQPTGNNLPEVWSLQDCFDYAKKNNIQLQTLTKDIALSEQDLLQARSARLPNLSASSNQTFTNSKNTNPVVGGFQTQSSFSSNYGVNSSLILYQGGFISNNIQSKQLSIKSAGLTLEQAENDITIQITQAYLNILLEKESITAFQNLVQTSQAQYNNGKILFDEGSIAKKDLIQLEATLATDQYNLAIAQNLLRQYTLTLKQILQLPSSYYFQVQAPVQLNLLEEFTQLQQAQDSALQNRPEVKNGEITLQQVNIQLKQAHAAARPTLSAGAALTSGYSDNQNTKYLSQLNNNFYQRLGINIAIPIFSNRINKTNIEKLKIEIEQSKLALQNTKMVLSQEVEQAYINLLNARGQYAAAQTQFLANEENYRIANEQLKLGAVNMVDFLVQKNSYIQAQQALLQSKYSVVLNQGIYEFYMGKPITL